MGPSGLSTIQRFWSHTKKIANGCITWIARTNNRGYGMFGVKIDGRWKTVSAHRWIFGETLGIAPPKVAMHSCDNPPCVALQHLDSGTLRGNLLDSIRKGRRVYPRGRESPHAKLSATDILEIRRLSQEGGISQRAIAAKFGVCHKTIGKILKEKR